MSQPLSFQDVILRLLGLKQNVPKTYAMTFYYPARGIGTVWDRVAGKVSAAGGTVLLNCTAEEVRVAGGRARRVCCVQDGRPVDLAADTIVGTIPLPAFVEALRPRPPQRAIDAARGLQFRSIRFLFERRPVVAPVVNTGECVRDQDNQEQNRDGESPKERSVSGCGRIDQVAGGRFEANLQLLSQFCRGLPPFLGLRCETPLNDTVQGGGAFFGLGPAESFAARCDHFLQDIVPVGVRSFLIKRTFACQQFPQHHAE